MLSLGLRTRHVLSQPPRARMDCDPKMEHHDMPRAKGLGILRAAQIGTSLRASPTDRHKIVLGKSWDRK